MKRLCCMVFAALLCSHAVAANRHLLIVVGLPGEAHFGKLFGEWANDMQRIAIDALGIPADNVIVLRADAETENRRSHRRGIEQALRTLTTRSDAQDFVMVLLIGHGTARNGRSSFNIPGPDISSDELSQWLQPLRERTLVVVNTTSSSGDFISDLSAPGRAIVTATASGGEYQFAHFGGHFVRAFAAEAADTDKNQRVSLLEAFNYARDSVRRRFEKDERILTEHALLDDDADGVGSRAPDGSSDGQLAATLFLEPTFAERAPEQAQNRRLVALDIEAAALVEQIDALKRRRQRLVDTEYFGALETLLVSLALNRRDFRSLADARQD